jgi:hypothetical protein
MKIIIEKFGGLKICRIFAVRFKNNGALKSDEI